MNTTIATRTESRFDNKRDNPERRRRQVVCETTELERWENEGGGVSHGQHSHSLRVPGRGLPTEARHVSMKQGNAFLHRAVVAMKRGLLQYASQCSLRVPAREADRRRQLDRLVARQQRSIRRLSELLNERECHIEWGTFPVAYTSFNFVELSFLWPRIADSQARLVHMLEAVQSELEHDTQASAVLDDILQTERGISVILNTALRATESAPQNVRDHRGPLVNAR